MHPVIDTVAIEARALGLSERAILDILLQPHPEAALREARTAVELAAFGKRPELAEEYLLDVRGLRARILADRAAADEALHIDTTPPVKHRGIWTNRNS